MTNGHASMAVQPQTGPASVPQTNTLRIPARGVQHGTEGSLSGLWEVSTVAGVYFSVHPEHGDPFILQLYTGHWTGL